MNKYSSATF